MAKRPDLIVVSGELKGRRFAVGEGALRLGRSSSNDIHVPDEELSRNHCLFEQSGEEGIRLTDLASANGTYVNGKQLGNDPIELKEGDIVEVGQLCIAVGKVDSAKPYTAGKLVDLGLGEPSTPAKETEGASTNRSPIANILWIVAILVAASAIAIILFMPTVKRQSAPTVASSQFAPVVREIYYEKIHANQEGIFRYVLRYTEDAGLSVSLDDTANDRRMPTKTRRLSAEDQATLNEILGWQMLKGLAGDYAGIEPDPPALDSVLLKVVYTSGIHVISVINALPPEEFEEVQKRLEAFSQVQLGVVALAYSRDELVRRAEESTKFGDVKWDERDIDYGNLAVAILAYQEALHYLETVNPKPECAELAREGLARAKAERDKRCTDHRINAEKEVGVRNWAAAREEFKIILQIVPEREDDRYRAAKSKLLEVENNLKREGGR